MAALIAMTCSVVSSEDTRSRPDCPTASTEDQPYNCSAALFQYTTVPAGSVAMTACPTASSSSASKPVTPVACPRIEPTPGAGPSGFTTSVTADRPADPATASASHGART